MEHEDFKLMYKNADNISKVQSDYNKIIDFSTNIDTIKITFYDNKSVSELIFFINEQGKLETRYESEVKEFDFAEKEKKYEEFMTEMQDSMPSAKEIISEFSYEELIDLDELFHGIRYDYVIYSSTKDTFGVSVSKMHDIFAIDELEKDGFSTIKEVRTYIQKLSSMYPAGRIRGLDYTLLTKIEDVLSDNLPKYVRFMFDDNLYAIEFRLDDGIGGWSASSNIIINGNNEREIAYGEELHSIIQGIEESISNYK